MRRWGLLWRGELVARAGEWQAFAPLAEALKGAVIVPIEERPEEVRVLDVAEVAA